MIQKQSRAWYNGRTKASQALDEGSIPFARTKNKTGPCGRIYFLFFLLKKYIDTVAVFL